MLLDKAILLYIHINNQDCTRANGGAIGLTNGERDWQVWLNAGVFNIPLLTQTLDTSIQVATPGFLNSISDPELIDNMMEQAKKFGATFIKEFATQFDFCLDNKYDHKVQIINDDSIHRVKIEINDMKVNM